MEKRIRTGSGFRAQGVVERKSGCNGLVPVREGWLRKLRSGLDGERRNGWHGCERSGNKESGTKYKPPLPASSSTFAFYFHYMLFCYCA